MNIAEWDDVITHLLLEKSHAIQLVQSFESTDRKIIVKNKQKSLLQQMMKDASRKIYKKHLQNETAPTLVEKITVIEALISKIQRGKEHEDTTLAAVLLQEIGEAILIAQKYRMDMIHTISEQKYPTLVWFVHPTAFHPSDFKLGTSYSGEHLNFYGDKVTSAAVINTINKLYGLLNVVSRKGNMYLHIVKGQDDIAGPKQIQDLLTLLQRKDRVHISENAFPTAEDIAFLELKMRSKFGCSLKSVRHVVTGMSVPFCVCHTATMLRNSLAYTHKGLVAVPQYANDVFVDMEFVSTDNPGGIFFVNMITHPSGSLDTGYDKVAMVPRISLAK